MTRRSTKQRRAARRRSQPYRLTATDLRGWANPLRHPGLAAFADLFQRAFLEPILERVLVSSPELRRITNELEDLRTARTSHHPT